MLVICLTKLINFTGPGSRPGPVVDPAGSYARSFGPGFKLLLALVVVRAKSQILPREAPIASPAATAVGLRPRGAVFDYKRNQRSLRSLPLWGNSQRSEPLRPSQGASPPGPPYWENESIFRSCERSELFSHLGIHREVNSLSVNFSLEREFQDPRLTPRNQAPSGPEIWEIWQLLPDFSSLSRSESEISVLQKSSARALQALAEMGFSCSSGLTRSGP